MYSDDIDPDEAIRVAMASLAGAGAQIPRVLSIGLQVASDQELIEAGFGLQMSADALNRLLTFRGYGPESRS